MISVVTGRVELHNLLTSLSLWSDNAASRQRLGESMRVTFSDQKPFVMWTRGLILKAQRPTVSLAVIGQDQET